jgi:hypothetical protein
MNVFFDSILQLTTNSRWLHQQRQNKNMGIAYNKLVRTPPKQRAGFSDLALGK